MLSASEPSLLVMLVASTPLNDRLVDVVLVPLTDGETLPLPLTPTGESSEETPDSEPKSPVKLRVDVGVLVSCSPVICRETVADSAWTSAWSDVTFTKTSETPTSSVTSTPRVTEASTSIPSFTVFLNPSFSYET